jgi:Tfp pilus assembly protein PilX
MRCEHNSPRSSASAPASSAMPASGCGRIRDQGIALVLTLLLLFLLSVIGLAAVLSTSSDMLINGYYSNYRGAFYAADSGLTLARQALVTAFDDTGNFPSGTSFSTPPQGAAVQTWGSNVATVIANLYGHGYSVNRAGPAQTSWQGSFTILPMTITSSQSSGTPKTDSLGNPYYQYTYTYTLTSVGSALGSETTKVVEQGSVMVNIYAGAGTTSYPTSFAAFGAYIGKFDPCSAPLVQGYLTGPMYAQGEFNFGSGNPGYTFTDPVSNTNSTFSYYTTDRYGRQSCTRSGTVPYTGVNTTFNGGYNLGVSSIPVPSNDFSQRWAVLDGKGCGENNGNVCGDPTTPAPTQPTPTEMNALLKDITGTAYPSGGATSGVFLPYSCSGGTCSLNSNAGGIYVEGNASVVLSTSGTSGQVFTVAQTGSGSTGSPVVTQVGSTSCNTTTSHGSTSTTCTASYQRQTTTTTPTTYTTVTVDPTANTTTVQAYTSNGISTVTATGSSSCTVSGSGGCSPSAPSSFSGGTTSNSTSNSATTNLPLTGVPQDLVTTTPQDATMLYVNGDITSLSGPGSGAAIQNNSMVTVVGNGDITQTGNIVYATRPVTTVANQIVSGSSPPCCNGDPVDTLIPQYQNMNQVLGIFTATGNFILSPSHSGANIETDASIAMISQAGVSDSSIGHMATGNSVGTWTNLGGRIENRAHSVSINTSNVYFDRRFTARQGFAPPWFPSTTVSQDEIYSGSAALPQAQPPSRTLWQIQTAGM